MKALVTTWCWVGSTRRELTRDPLILRRDPMRQLPAGRRPAANCRGDSVVRHLENVVQNECHPLCGTEAFEHDEQRQPDLIIEGHPVSRIDGRRSVGVVLLGHVLRALATRRGRLDVIQTQPAGHHDQPATLVVDIGNGCLQQPKEGLLHHIFGRPDVAEHTKCQVHQIGAMRSPRISYLVVLRIHKAKGRDSRPKCDTRLSRSVTLWGAAASFQVMSRIPTHTVDDAPPACRLCSKTSSNSPRPDGR